VACLDEAGRGPLAGPVVAAAVSSERACDYTSFTGLRDSKKLSAKQREKFYKLITANKNMAWGIGIVSEKVIDRINILEATKLAMLKALEKMKSKKVKVDFLILDGRMRINSSLPQKSIVKADEKVFSCAASSILAKVTRDRLMEKYGCKYPRYKFDIHKGYPTKEHCRILRRYGPCPIHRKSFGPVSECLTKKR